MTYEELVEQCRELGFHVLRNRDLPASAPTNALMILDRDDWYQYVTSAHNEQMQFGIVLRKCQKRNAEKRLYEAMRLACVDIEEAIRSIEQTPTN